MEKPRIQMYFHCKTCATGKLAVGWTAEGLQVFCERCDKNVIDIDFQGQQHPLYDAEKVRTDQQNKALHLWCEQCAKTLTEAGITAKVIVAKGFDVPITKEIFKELVWRPFQKSMIGKASSTEINTKDPKRIYEAIVLNFGEKGIELPPFPSLEGKILSSIN